MLVAWQPVEFLQPRPGRELLATRGIAEGEVTCSGVSDDDCGRLQQQLQLQQQLLQQPQRARMLCNLAFSLHRRWSNGRSASRPGRHTKHQLVAAIASVVAKTLPLVQCFSLSRSVDFPRFCSPFDRGYRTAEQAWQGSALTRNFWI